MGVCEGSKDTDLCEDRMNSLTGCTTMKVCIRRPEAPLCMHDLGIGIFTVGQHGPFFSACAVLLRGYI